MTPLQLSILIHYMGHSNDYRFGDFSAPAVREAIDWFLGEAGMLEPSDKTEYPDAQLRLTEKGRFFVEELCKMPLPTHAWVMPSNAAVSGRRPDQPE